MHIHIVGICGTFMGGIAQIAKEAGHHVTGCDAHVYPPMSTALAQAGIDVVEGWDPSQITTFHPDLFVIGNAISRGNPLLEAILNAGCPYTSGPQWLAEEILVHRRVLAVAGTHGKTTTTSMLAWILEDQGLEPGFLIGGVTQWSERSARLGHPSAPFVIEADEYDTAFFDKRSKFVHYRPWVAILNNLEYDHADIFPNLEAIETQFHHMVRTMPSEGLVIANAQSDALTRVLERGCWSRVTAFNAPCSWHVTESGEVLEGTTSHGLLRLGMPGHYNRCNALAAVLAARDVGVSIEAGIDALSRFAGVKRRQEVKGEVNGITVIDDFAHHPTAIFETLEAVKTQYAPRRIVAVLEPRSNTMKLGTMKDRLAGSLAHADRVFCYAPAQVHWSPESALASLGTKATTKHVFEELLDAIVKELRPGDVVLCMSNGAFEGIHEKLLARLAQVSTGS